jgi:hypothetical protein
MFSSLPEHEESKKVETGDIHSPSKNMVRFRVSVVFNVLGNCGMDYDLPQFLLFFYPACSVKPRKLICGDTFICCF